MNNTTPQAVSAALPPAAARPAVRLLGTEVIDVEVGGSGVSARFTLSPDHAESLSADLHAAACRLRDGRGGLTAISVGVTVWPDGAAITDAW